MFIILIRTFILFFIVTASMRIMGKRQIGQLQPYELVVAIMISELASLPMQDTRIPLIHGIIPIITLFSIQIIISFVELKYQNARDIIDGKASIVIEKGNLVLSELKDQLFTVNDLLEELRIKGYFSIQDIEYAILETNGQLSIIPKKETTPVEKKDMNITVTAQNLPLPIISSGKINYTNLTLLNKDETWLKEQLRTNNFKSEKEVFLAVMDCDNNLYIHGYKNYNEKSTEVKL
ncbi:DUF421 domain-containing protein [Clostridium oryzae]|uniref:YetF C-terminal domain-containing protein n=1 Tax=Clostridium oryzae TaxID=1450648 RepID=A0A1V4IJC4_9CLOT|nr:DUF421 domain-containing protein [Clostridium oryzae]OPJ60112.1 hypothetical protein CLORY_29750 [Clostridium oryzae]